MVIQRARDWETQLAAQWNNYCAKWATRRGPTGRRFGQMQESDLVCVVSLVICIVAGGYVLTAQLLALVGSHTDAAYYRHMRPLAYWLGIAAMYPLHVATRPPKVGA